MSAFVFIAWVLALTFTDSTALTKAYEDSDHTIVIAVMHRHISLCAGTHSFGEVVIYECLNISFWLPLLAWHKQHSHLMTSALIGKSRKLIAYSWVVWQPLNEGRVPAATCSVFATQLLYTLLYTW